MPGIVWIFSAIIGLISIPSAWADGLPQMNRPTASLLTSDSLEVWLRYDQFFPQLDFAGYGNNALTTSTLDVFSNIQAGLNYGITDRWNFRLNGILNRQRANRKKEPKIVESQFRGVEAQLQYRFLNRGAHALFVRGGFSYHRTNDQTVTSLQVGKLLISGNPYIFRSSSSDMAPRLGLGWAFKSSDDLRFHLGLEARDFRIHASYSSPTQFIANALQQQMPQTTPWKEMHTVVLAGFEYAFLSDFGVALDYQHVQISRSGYLPRQGYADYESADIVDVNLFWHFQADWALNIGGHYNSHFVLGEYPLLYTRRSNHLFDTPFGYLSIGMAYRFD